MMMSDLEFSYYDVPWNDLVIQEATRDWCLFPYPGHPKGCPNYGKHKACPPNASMLDEYFDKRRPVSFVVARFDLAEHEKRMMERNSGWSRRQARCVLYWQGSVRSRLKKKVMDYMKRVGYDKWSDRPEAMGLNLFRTFYKHGLKLQKDPQDFVKGGEKGSGKA
jgi:hypothetical protein